MTITISFKRLALWVAAVVAAFAAFLFVTWPFGYCAITGQSIWLGCYWPPTGWR